MQFTSNMILPLLLFLLVPFFIATVSSLVIIEVWGTVDDSTSSEEYFGTWMDCMSRCFWEPSCMVISKTDSGCQLYRFGKVQSITVSARITDGELGIKKLLSTCPLDSAAAIQDSVETYQTDEVVYEYSISSTGVDGGRELKFTFEYFIQCRPGSFISVRGENRVCITARLFPEPTVCRNREQGATLCTEPGVMGLTGPYSTDEGFDMSKRHMSECPTYANCNFWIDGNRTDFSFIAVTDSSLNGTSGYNFKTPINQNLPNRSCPFLATKGNETGSVHITECYQTKQSDYCQRGAMCRVEPIYEF